MKRMIPMLMVVSAVVTMTAVMAAQAQAPAAVPDLTGKWTMKVSGGPHGDAAMALSLKQEGEKVTAGFNPGHDGEIPMTGTFVKGSLTLKSPANDDGAVITMKGTLKADGTLSGFLSSAMGDMTWSAVRDKGKSAVRENSK
jgi:hypothetical protein